MRYAKLTKLGGLMIEASQADYPDYKGFLLCLECGEPVFLRKSHQRGDTVIPSAFVHHKAVPEVSICELRVGRYSQRDVEVAHSQARNQRLQRLTISLWKFLKTNLSMSLQGWAKYVSDTKRVKMFSEVVAYGEEVWTTNHDFILNDTLPRVAELMNQRDPRIGIAPAMQSKVNAFLTSRSRDWQLHCEITKEALTLFLKSSVMAEIRHRLCCCLCHPSAMEMIPDLLDLDTATNEWREKFVSYTTLYVVFIFLTVDWIEVFE